MAIRFPDRSLSYAELARGAGGIARAVQGMGRIALLAEPRIETCVGVIGALWAGVPVVLINPKSGASELAHIADDARPEALLAGLGSDPPAVFRDCATVVSTSMPSSLRGSTRPSPPLRRRP